jgi:hypothetical protein
MHVLRPSGQTQPFILVDMMTGNFMIQLDETCVSDNLQLQTLCVQWLLMIYPLLKGNGIGW